MSSALDEKLACIAVGMGAEMGEFLSCLVTAEIASLVDERDLIERKIQRLQQVLTGCCAKDAIPPA